MELTGGGAYSILDLVGAPSTIGLGVAAIRKGGDIVVVGLYGGELKLPTVYFPLRGMGVRGSYVGTLPDLKELVALAQKGTLKPIKVTRRKLYGELAELRHSLDIPCVLVTHDLDEATVAGVPNANAACNRWPHRWPCNAASASRPTKPPPPRSTPIARTTCWCSLAHWISTSLWRMN